MSVDPSVSNTLVRFLAIRARTFTIVPFVGSEMIHIDIYLAILLINV